MLKVWFGFISSIWRKNIKSQTSKFGMINCFICIPTFNQCRRCTDLSDDCTLLYMMFVGGIFCFVSILVISRLWSTVEMFFFFLKIDFDKYFWFRIDFVFCFVLQAQSKSSNNIYDPSSFDTSSLRFFLIHKKKKNRNCKIVICIWICCHPFRWPRKIWSILYLNTRIFYLILFFCLAVDGRNI